MLNNYYPRVFSLTIVANTIRTTRPGTTPGRGNTERKF